MTDTAPAGNRIRLTSFARRLDFWLVRVVGILAVAGAILAVRLQRATRFFVSTSPPVLPASTHGVSRRVVEVLPVHDWSAFQARSSRGSTNGLLARFRLAGTFFVEGDSGMDIRKAVLDQTDIRAQRIVSEGERLDGEIRVARVLQDRVVLQVGRQELELRLSFAGTSERGPAEPGAALSPSESEEAAWLGGARTGENRWRFSRRALLAYYQQLREDPSRLVAVFDSFAPLYGTNHQIEGYQIRMTGEEDFFKAVGLQENDVVRAANSMRMTSRRRAEYLIREFLADRANVFVLDVERNGQPLKLIYEVRPDADTATNGTEGGTGRLR